jgi:hypothetical protein
MREMGICMEHCGPVIRKWLPDSLVGRFEFSYMEIGIAHGSTFSAICEVLSEQRGLNWKAYGVDLPDGWSLEPDLLKSNIAEFGDRVEIILKPSLEVLKNWKTPLNFVLIDGCHEKECCKADFEAVEPHIAPGGVVCFHDSGQNEQGGSPQPHRGKPIGVRAAIRELGFIGGRRAGWVKLEDFPKTNPGPTGVFLVRKASSK